VPPSVSLAHTGIDVDRPYSFHVAHLDRIFRPERAIFLERTRDALRLVEVPQRVELGHDLDAIADRRADLAVRLEPDLQIFRRQQTAVGSLGERIERPDLHRRVAFRQQALREFVRALHERDLIVVRTFRTGRRVARRDAPARHRTRVVVVARTGVVRANPLPALSAQQLADRLIHRLAEDVPKRDVDHGCRSNLGAAARESQIAAHELPAVRLDRERILAEQIRRDQLVNLRFHRGRAARSLAEPDQSFVRMNLREQQIRPIGQANGFDRGDLHGDARLLRN
jgi:hypothetical protein